MRDVNTLRETISGDVVVLLAAVHRDDIRDMSEYQHTNVNGAENVAMVCEEKGIDRLFLPVLSPSMDLPSLGLMKVVPLTRLMIRAN